MALTSYVNMEHAATNNNVSAQVRFKYTATRDSSGKNVIFKIEPQVFYDGSSYSSNAAMVYFTKASATSSSKPNDFSHACACNKTYAGGFGPWYGGTGTSTKSSDSDYPVDSDAWVTGNWNNISIPVDPTATSVKLYFNYYGGLGYGNYESDPNSKKGTFLWKNKADKYRFYATFTVPVGYTEISIPNTTVTLTSDIEGAEIYANDKVVVSWANATAGTNNAVASYDLYGAYYTTTKTADGSSKAWSTAIKIASGVTSPYSISRTKLEEVFGSRANALYTNPQATSGWHRFRFTIKANPKNYGSTKSYSNSSYLVWNEKPTSPTITVDEVINAKDIKDLSAKLSFTNSIDYLYPNTDNYITNPSKTSFPKRYDYYFSGINKTPSSYNWTNGATLTDTNAIGINIANDIDSYQPGHGLHYVHVKATDTIANSSIVTKGYLVGKELILNNATINTLEINANTVISIPPTSLDEVPLFNTSETLTIYAGINGEWKELDTKTRSAQSELNETTHFSVLSQILKQFSDLSKVNFYNDDIEVNFKIKITPNDDVRLEREYSLPSAIFKPLKFSSNIVEADGNSKFYYRYGFYYPYVKASIGVKNNISIPEGLRFKVEYSYSELGISSSIEEGSWIDVTPVNENNVDSFALSTFTKENVAIKMRAKLTIIDTGESYVVPCVWNNFNLTAGDFSPYTIHCINSAPSALLTTNLIVKPGDNPYSIYPDYTLNWNSQISDIIGDDGVSYIRILDRSLKINDNTIAQYSGFSEIYRTGEEKTFINQSLNFVAGQDEETKEEFAIIKSGILWEQNITNIQLALEVIKDYYFVEELSYQELLLPERGWTSINGQTDFGNANTKIITSNKTSFNTKYKFSIPQTIANIDITRRGG